MNLCFFKSKYQNQITCKYYEISNLEPVQVLAIINISFVLPFTKGIMAFHAIFIVGSPFKRKLSV